jgi:hypothetical protein
MPLPPAARLEVNELDRKELLVLRQQRSIPRGILLRVNTTIPDLFSGWPAPAA